MFQFLCTVRKTLVLGALSLMFGCTSLPDGQKPSAASTVVGERRVVALLPENRSTARLRAVAQSEGYVLQDISALRSLDLTMLTFMTPVGVTGAEAIATLEAAEPASTVGINHAYRIQQSAGNGSPLDYAGNMMRWRRGGCVARGPVGVIDTGIDAAAPALSGAKIISRQFFDGSAIQATHGTDVASVLAAPDRLTGLTIYGADVFGQQDATGPMAGADALVRALDWMSGENVRFVNLALAGPYNKLLDLAVTRASARGLILVAAVGNDGPRVDPLYPAGFEEVIAVTAVDANARIYRKAVRGRHVDVAAPGVDVLVSSGGGARFLTGTSIATPFVTARLVADRSLGRASSVTEVRQRLAVTSKELGPVGRDTMFGHGLALAEGLC